MMATTCPLPSRPWPWFTAFFLGLACLFWFGRGLDFSAYAHPDERNKINQIVQSYYNFNHPLLMLNSARVVAMVAGKESDFEAVKRIGRSVSVVYASLAVGILSLAMGRLYGRWVAVATGLFLMANPHLFEFAHYFKEEPTVLLGISLTILAMVFYTLRPGLVATILCGAAAGLAFSGKYAGILVMPFAAYVVLVASRNRLRDALVFLLAFAAIFLLVNFPALMSINNAANSLDREVVRLTGADQEVRRSIPHGVYTRRYLDISTPILLCLLAIYAWSLFARRFKLLPVEWAITLIPAAYFAVLSFIPVTSNRYFLPCGVLAACLSAAALPIILGWKKGKWIAVSLIVISLGWSAPKLVKANEGFQADHLAELVKFLENEIPAESLLLIGEDMGIPPLKSLRAKNHSITPGETLESLREKGFTHIVVIPRNYKNFLTKTQNRTSLSDKDFLKIKNFYESLFNRATLLRRWEEGVNSYLAREMTLFSLQERDSAPVPTQGNQAL
jgi:hypothetical protein